MEGSIFQLTYMDEETYSYDPELTAAVIPTISGLLDSMLAFGSENW